MTPVDQPTAIQRAAREAAQRTATDQGLPAKVTDQRVVEQVAVILRAPAPAVGSGERREAA